MTVTLSREVKEFEIVVPFFFETKLQKISGTEYLISVDKDMEQFFDLARCLSYIESIRIGNSVIQIEHTGSDGTSERRIMIKFSASAEPEQVQSFETFWAFSEKKYIPTIDVYSYGIECKSDITFLINLMKKFSFIDFIEQDSQIKMF